GSVAALISDDLDVVKGYKQTIEMLWADAKDIASLL
ncbi:hypothetical protein A2U01_0051587, partial [Trifolium medium]|nr:hypothetical protein [Trifolium medium]